ncbi:MAG: GNAT family N-acetyltransferase [Deltaproteobacteria bacterium]|nr:GNAT family N-acetyltransferase [Candidatus Zymogenaceae bacterium]
MNIVRTHSSNKDFTELCILLDRELNSRYGGALSKYETNNNIIENNQAVILGYIDGVPAACGCFKALDTEKIEMKRMFVKAEYRKNGFTTSILTSLENWAKELDFSIALLETGKGQPEAINLYKK